MAININESDNDIGYNSLDIDTVEQENVSQPTVEMNDISDAPDIVLNDFLNSIGTITDAAEKEMAQSDPTMAKDAAIAKVSVNQKNVANELHGSAKTLTNMAIPSDNTSSTTSSSETSDSGDEDFKSRTYDEIKEILDECIPCLDRPAIAGSYKAAISEMFKMFYQLFDMVATLPRILDLLVPPVNTYSLVCGILDALRSTCVPDLRRILLLIQWYLSQLFLNKLKKFTFSLEINLDLIFLPFYAALQTLIAMILNEILSPIICVVNSLKTQLNKILIDAEGVTTIQKLTYLIDKLQQPVDEALRKLTMARHDWQVYMCKLGVNIKDTLNVIADIEEFLYIYQIIESLIRLKSLTNKCDQRDGAVKDVYENIYNAEVKDNGDIVIEQPIEINDDEENILNDIVDTFINVHSGTKITDPSGYKIKYGDIEDEVRNIYNNQSDLSEADAKYAGETSLSYSLAATEESIGDIYDVIDRFKSSKQNTENQDNIESKHVVVGNIYDCME